MKQFNILTGPKLDITYLSPAFLSLGALYAILALLGKIEVLILLLIAIDSGLAEMSDANLASLFGIFCQFQVLFCSSEISGLF